MNRVLPLLGMDRMLVKAVVGAPPCPLDEEKSDALRVCRPVRHVHGGRGNPAYDHLATSSARLRNPTAVDWDMIFWLARLSWNSRLAVRLCLSSSNHLVVRAALVMVIVDGTSHDLCLVDHIHRICGRLVYVYLVISIVMVRLNGVDASGDCACVCACLTVRRPRRCVVCACCGDYPHHLCVHSCGFFYCPDQRPDRPPSSKVVACWDRSSWLRARPVPAA